MADGGDEDEGGEKPYEPTPRRLQKAREQGDVPLSNDLTAAGVFTGFLLVGATFGAVSLNGIASTLSGFLGRADQMAEPFFQTQNGTVLGQILLALASDFASWMIVPGAFALLVLAAQQAIVFAPKKVAPKLSRISLLQNAKQKFGRSGLFEFAKSTSKLILIAIVLGFFLVARLPEIVSTLALSPAGGVMITLRLLMSFLVVVIVIIGAMGVIEFLFKRAEHLRKNRMSHKELMDELKESEGDPHIKQKRRQKAMDIASSRAIQDVPDADVVIVNPEHYAVALKWERGSPTAPVCVAKGVDEVAARIREVAIEASVPIRRDPPTARALFATVEIGEEVQPEHYRPVAAAIRFADAVRKRAKAGYGRG